MNVSTKVANTWAEIIKSPEMQALMEKQGLESYALPPDETTALIKESVASYGKVIADSNTVWKP
jgi:tripartite-type tricarboxylate transporter receptor subunit TctC